MSSGGDAGLRIRRIAVPTPFPVGDVNAYLLEAEPLTLVDCGPLTEEAWEALSAGVAGAGRRLEEVRRLVLTHPHQDHTGLAERVRRVSGCQVFAHPVDHARLLNQRGEWEGIVDFLSSLCRSAGAPPTHIEALRDGLRSLHGYAEPLTAVEPLDEGHELFWEGAGKRGNLTVLHTPGHARGALCLWDGATGDLLSGDTLLGEISSNALAEPAPAGGREKTLPQYLGTLRRLAALGARRVHPGHGELVEADPAPLVDARLRFHDKRARRILALVRAGIKTPWEIADRLFPGLPPSAVFLAVSEVLGHLDLLAARGDVEFEGQGDDWGIRPA